MDKKRPWCPNCNEELRIVEVVSCNESRYYWTCECVLDTDEPDEKDYMK